MLSLIYLDLLSQLQHLLGTSKGQMKRCTVCEDVPIIKPGSHVSSFSRVQTLGFVISPDHPKTPLDSQGDARGICSNLSCLFGRRRRHRETYQVATHSVATNGPLAQSHFGWRSLVSGMRWIFVCHYRALDCL